MTRAEIPDAQRLLYEVYYEEQKWEPLQPNASQLRADHSQRRIVDDLDASAIWVGVFTKGKLVGVTRILERTRMGRLEIERYVDLPASLLADRVVIEANRVAVLAKHRRTLTLAVLHTYCEWMGTRLGALRSIGTATEKIARGPARRYGWLATEVSFRYHPDDPEPVRVLTCPFAWQHR
ncbi:MAG: GNAT family N-acyltransferase, partial [Nannocystaceae bacterium]